eukprot:2302444-Rhodomonas_salina.1
MTDEEKKRGKSEEKKKKKRPGVWGARAGRGRGRGQQGGRRGNRGLHPRYCRCAPQACRLPTAACLRVRPAARLRPGQRERGER